MTDRCKQCKENDEDDFGIRCGFCSWFDGEEEIEKEDMQALARMKGD